MTREDRDLVIDVHTSGACLLIFTDDEARALRATEGELHGARQANLAKILAGVVAPPLALGTVKRLGALLGAAGGFDVVGAHVAWLARAGDRVFTSDPGDLSDLLDALSVEADVVRV